VLAAGQILARIAADNSRGEFPFVLTGDLNDTPDSPEIRTFLGFEAYPMKDLTSGIKTSFHNFFRCREDCKIDYIFSNKDTAVSDVRVWDDLKDGMPLSDHYPIFAELALPETIA
jgi:endonuclease/exonuclease/phosphatase family metal-dependent hydrolase